jgi:type II secretory pathway pseudopilin PulG
MSMDAAPAREPHLTVPYRGVGQVTRLTKERPMSSKHNGPVHAVPRFLDTYRSTLRSRDGIEVSIPNIIVAVAVSIALIAGTILGVVWIVPWTQDQNAKSQLGTAQSAEQLYYAQNNTYGSLAQLTSKTSSSNSTLVGGKDKMAINASTDGYCVYIKSDHGTEFWATEASTKIVTSNPGTSAGGASCPTSAS